MASIPQDSQSRSSRGFPAIIVTSALMLTMIAGTALAVSPGVARIPIHAPVASQPRSWAIVDIAKPTAQPVSWSIVNVIKPTYTPSPMPTMTATPIESPEVTLSLANSDTSGSSNLSGSVSQSLNQISSGGKYILVSISEQHLEAYENGQLIYSFVASTGMNHGTRAGTFSVLDKIPNAYGSTWNIWMPNWLGIYWSGSLENGIHALPILPSGDRLWSGFLGTPISFGCVVLGVDESLQLYNWADVGTPVEISR